LRWPKSLRLRWSGRSGPAQSLFGEAAPLPAPIHAPFSVPKPFLDMAGLVVCHREPERFALLYTLLTRIRDNRGALEDRADPLVQRLDRMAKEVRRDAHKMHAFVRFREVAEPDASVRMVAWFEPSITSSGGKRASSCAASPRCAGRSSPPRCPSTGTARR
jgi:DNA polymerase